MTTTFVRGCLAVGLALASLTCLAQGDPYPWRPIRIAIGFPPGGSSDNTVRLVAAALQRQTGQTVTVDNRPGASGAIAAKAVAAMAPDGYNLYSATSSSRAIAPPLNVRLGHDPVHGFAPVVLLGHGDLR